MIALNTLQNPVSEAGKRIYAAGRRFAAQERSARIKAAIDARRHPTPRWQMLTAKRLRLAFLRDRKQREIDMEMAAYIAERAYREKQDQENERRVSVSDIMRTVTMETGVSKSELMSNRRDQRVCRARHKCWWLAKQHTSLSLPAIGRMFGGRDHTTIMHGIAMHEWRMGKGEYAKAHRRRPEKRMAT